MRCSVGGVSVVPARMWRAHTSRVPCGNLLSGGRRLLLRNAYTPTASNGPVPRDSHTCGMPRGEVSPLAGKATWGRQHTIYSILVTHSRVKKRMSAAPFALNRLVSTHGGDVWPSPTVPADCKARLCRTRARGRKPLYTPLERNRASVGQCGLRRFR